MSLLSDLGTKIGTQLKTKADKLNTVVSEDNAIDFSAGVNFELTASAASITASNLQIGQSGNIIVHSAENITGWGAEFKFKTVPTDLLGDEVFAYYIEDASNIWIGRVQ